MNIHNTLPGYDDLDDVMVHSAARSEAKAPVCPTDAAIVYTVAVQHGMTFDQACERLQGIDWNAVRGIEI